MDILKQIQADLLAENVSLSTVLRKAKVLAYQLDSEELKNWVSKEQDGYQDVDDLPDYRVIPTGCFGVWTNGKWSVENYSVPLYKIQDEALKNILTKYHVFGGIRTVEQMSIGGGIKIRLPAGVIGTVNTLVGEHGFGFLEINYALMPHHFEQLIDTVKNRLLDFVLELDEGWQIDENPPSHNELENLVSVTIYNNPEGGSVSVFDQRGQQVNYQYNAAGNININAIQNKHELIGELEKLRSEIESAKEAEAIDEDTAVEAEYHILQATKEAQKEKPDKDSFFKNVSKAGEILENAKVAVGLVQAVLQIAELGKNLLG